MARPRRSCSVSGRGAADEFSCAGPCAPTPNAATHARAQARSASLRVLTGKKENLDWALYKLGQYVEEKESHKTVIIVGNEATGLWKKALGMAKADDLIEIVRSVADDKGAAAR